jgi:hypothetical protein
MGTHKGTRIMLSEIRALFGNRIFFVMVGLGLAIFAWREFFASVAAPGSARNVIEQGRNAEQREKAIAEKENAAAITANIRARPMSLLPPCPTCAEPPKGETQLERMRRIKAESEGKARN